MNEGVLSPALYLVISSAILYSVTSHPAMGSGPSVDDPFEQVRSRTTHVLVKVKGRDPSRHLTTYPGVDGDLTSQLEFGFPPAHHRHHSNDRLEMVDASTQLDQQQGIKKVTLRHPWEDVYMTSDAYHGVRACQYATTSTRRSVMCDTSPYLFFESWNTTRDCARIRLNVRRDAAHAARVTYAYVTPVTWELRLRNQVTLLTQALAEATQRACRESVSILFEEQVKTFKKKKRRRRRRRHHRQRRCTADPVQVRARLINAITMDRLRRDVKRSLKSNLDCVHPKQQQQTNYDVINTVPWKLMSSEVKSSLMCHVGYVVRKQLRRGLLGLARTDCVNSSLWGRMGEKRRRKLLDHYLDVAWSRRGARTDAWLLGIAQSSIESRTSAFCIEQVT